MMQYATLLCTLLLFTIHGNAQVGVNNADPEQALDVNGKIKLADDGIAPSAGTLRYNASEGEFEGHNGIEWSSLSGVGGGTVPYQGAIPIWGTVSASPSSSSEAVFLTLDGTTVDIGTTAPAGKILVLTYAQATTTTFNESSRYSILLQIVRSGTFAQSMRMNCQTADCPPMVSESGPLFLVAPGDEIRATNNSFSSGEIRIEFRGFLVDALDY
ncbi:MAG: hypothetical protein WA952_01025 [Lewinella sp.]